MITDEINTPLDSKGGFSDVKHTLISKEILKNKVFKLSNLAGFETETLEAMEELAIKFHEWMRENGWKFLRINNKEAAYVNSYEREIFVHGSEYHYERLVRNFGKQIDELFNLFNNENKENAKRV